MVELRYREHRVVPLTPESSTEHLAAATSPVVPMTLIALTTVVVVECTRAVFSLTYKLGESIGFLVAGLIVVALFASPLVAPVLRRVVSPRVLLPAAIGALAAGRLTVQVVAWPSFAMVAVLLGLGLVALTLVTASLRAHQPDGSLLAAIGVTAGAGLDTVFRSTGITWDTIWRDDVFAWVLTIAVVGGLAVAAVLCSRAGVVPSGEDRHAGLPAFLVWPYLYLLAFFSQSAAYVDSSAGVPVVIGLGVALGNAALAIVVLAAAGRKGLSRSVAAVVTGVLTVLAFALTGVTGAAAILCCVAAQVAAAALYGSAAGANRGEETSPSLRRTSVAFAAGGLVFAIATLAYTIHPLQPLPVSNRFVAAAVAFTMLLTIRAHPERSDAITPATARVPRMLASALVALMVVVPLVITVTWPAVETTTATNRPLEVMTFNIDEGIANGPLDLEEVAGTIEKAHPDVVVIEEVGRGWAVSGMTDEAEWLRRRLGLPYGWAPANDNQFGNIVLSRLPILRREALVLPQREGNQQRSALFLTVDPGDGKPVLIIGTHLENGDPQPFKDARAQAYHDIIAKWNGQPRTVFLGDFNTYPREVPPGWPELNIPLDAGFHTPQDIDHCTMPTSNQNCPDWIMASPDAQLSPVTIVVDRADHRPITAQVTFPP